MTPCPRSEVPRVLTIGVSWCKERASGYFPSPGVAERFSQKLAGR
jgi:hypothetical protein